MMSSSHRESYGNWRDLGYKKRVGSKVEVFRGVAMQTSGGLRKEDIKQITSSSGETRYVSRRKHDLSKHSDGLRRWRKAAAQLGYFQKGDDFKPLPPKGTPEYYKIKELADRM